MKGVLLTPFQRHVVIIVAFIDGNRFFRMFRSRVSVSAPLSFISVLYEQR